MVGKVFASTFMEWQSAKGEGHADDRHRQNVCAHRTNFAVQVLVVKGSNYFMVRDRPITLMYVFRRNNSRI